MRLFLATALAVLAASACDEGAGDAKSAGSAGASGGPDVNGPVSNPDAKFVGNITTKNAVRSDFASYWNQITPENEGKWASVEKTRGEYDWSALDQIYQYAADNDVIFKQHTFVWGRQQPAWLETLTAEEQQAAVKEWMNAFCARYPNTRLIDVVNEPPPHSTPAYLDAIGGAGASGWDWIVNAFTWAREACPNATLILNDYNNIEYAEDHQRFLDIVRAMQQAGAPIDALGAQAHDAYLVPTAQVQTYIDELAATGLPVYITEYDIPLTTDDLQLSTMSEQIPMFWNHESIKGITLWGYIVGSTWKDGTGLMTPEGEPRPAMTWLLNYLGR
jgi:endo-1,4-beta-xylanase